MSPSASDLRKRLRELAAEIPALVQRAQDSRPLWRGLVHEARRKCGKPGCRCVRGELHVSTVLCDRSGDKQRNFGLTHRDVELFCRMTEAYRRVRRARARLVKIHHEMLALFDRLEELRRNEAVRRHGGKLARRSESSP